MQLCSLLRSQSTAFSVWRVPKLIFSITSWAPIKTHSEPANTVSQQHIIAQCTILSLTDRYPTQEDLGPRLPQVFGANARRWGGWLLIRTLDAFHVSAALLSTDVIKCATSCCSLRAKWLVHETPWTFSVLLLTKLSCRAGGNT